MKFNCDRKELTLLWISVLCSERLLCSMLKSPNLHLPPIHVADLSPFNLRRSELHARVESMPPSLNRMRGRSLVGLRGSIAPIRGATTASIEFSTLPTVYDCTSAMENVTAWSLVRNLAMVDSLLHGLNKLARRAENL